MSEIRKIGRDFGTFRKQNLVVTSANVCFQNRLFLLGSFFFLSKINRGLIGQPHIYIYVFIYIYIYIYGAGPLRGPWGNERPGFRHLVPDSFCSLLYV